MKAITFEKFGSSTVLKQDIIEQPTPAKGEILIKIKHTSVNPVDWKIREGYLQSMLPHQFPIIPGWDAAGEVIALGESVTTFKTGDLVYAYTRLPTVHSGTYAEFIAIPESFVAHQPKSLESFQAASVPLVGLTAYQALHEAAQIKKGDKVLIIGGSGGVGSFAIQFAKIAKAEVTAIASTTNLEYLKKLGAHHVIDYTQDDIKQEALKIAPNGFDIVFDAVGGESLQLGSLLTHQNSRIVSIVETPSKGIFHFVYPNGKQLSVIAQMFDDGLLQIPTIQLRSIKDASLALDENQKRHTQGKIVLSIDF